MQGSPSPVPTGRRSALGDPAAAGGGQASRPLPQLARQRLWILGLPILVRLLVALAGLVLLFPWLHAHLHGGAPARPGDSLRLLALCLLLPGLPAALWQQWRHQRLAARPSHEAALNQQAVRWLREHDHFERLKLEGEMPRETVFLPGWRTRWLLVTNRRVLLFAASARQCQLLSEWSRRAVVTAGACDRLPPEATVPAWHRLLRLPPNLGICFTTGTVLRLRCASSVSARRVAELLMSSPAIPETDAAPLAEPAPARCWHQVAASVLLPGCGQLLQRRVAAGALLSVAALVLAGIELGPLLWALQDPAVAVSPVALAMALFLWFALALVAGSDARHFSATHRR